MSDMSNENTLHETNPVLPEHKTFNTAEYLQLQVNNLSPPILLSYQHS